MRRFHLGAPFLTLLKEPPARVFSSMSSTATCPFKLDPALISPASSASPSPKKGMAWNRTSQCWMDMKNGQPLSPSIAPRPPPDCSWSRTQHAWTPHSVDPVDTPEATAMKDGDEEPAQPQRQRAPKMQRPAVVPLKGAKYGECSKTVDLKEWKDLDLRPTVPSKLHSDYWRCSAGP